MAEPLRVELNGTLAGHHILIDRDRVTLGVLEDMESGRVKSALDALSAVIVGGDLPAGADRDGLRALTIAQLRDMMAGVEALGSIPKAG